MLILAISLALAAAAPKAAAPAILKEPAAPPTAWFLEDAKKGQWCAFPTQKAARAYGRKMKVSEDDDPPAVAWLRADNGKLISITEENVSDDARTEDRYFFGPDGRVSELRRTGLYVSDKSGTYVLKPGPAGKLVVTPDTEAAMKRMRSAHLYWVNWDTYGRLSEMPFSGLIAFKDGMVMVKTGCAKAR